MGMNRMKMKKKKGPQGPVSKGAYDPKSPKHDDEDSMVLGTKTNKNPAIRGLTPEPKKPKKLKG